jgi:hypothetical protein
MTSSVSSRRRLDTSSTTAKNATRESVRLLPRELIASNRYVSARVARSCRSSANSLSRTTICPEFQKPPP